MPIIDITGFNRAAVIQALYMAAAEPEGGKKPMDFEQAKHIWLNLDKSKEPVFKSIAGVNLFIDLSSDKLDTTEYEKHNGNGSSIKALSSLDRKTLVLDAAQLIAEYNASLDSLNKAMPYYEKFPETSKTMPDDKKESWEKRFKQIFAAVNEAYLKVSLHRWVANEEIDGIGV